MRIVLDTNVLVSAFISKDGNPAALLDVALTLPEIEVVLSDEILGEFGDILSRRKVRERLHYSKEDVSEFVRIIRNAVSIVKPTSNIKLVEEDPDDDDDDVIINTAFDGKANYIVSGDNHLKEMKEFKGIVILSPKMMLDTIVKRFGDIIFRV